MAKYATSSNVVRLHLNKEDNISTIDVLRALNQHQDSIIGAQTSYKGQAIDVVCTSDTGDQITNFTIGHQRIMRCTVVPSVTTRTDGDHPAGPVAKSCNICDMPQGDQTTNFTIGHHRIMRCTVVPSVTTRTDGDHPAGPVAKSCNICDMPQGDQTTNFTIGHHRIMRCTVVPSVTTRTDGDHPAGAVAKSCNICDMPQGDQTTNFTIGHQRIMRCTVVPSVTTRTDGDHPAGDVAKSCNICDMPQGDQTTNFTIGHQRIMRCTVVPSVTTRTDGDRPAGAVAKSCNICDMPQDDQITNFTIGHHRIMRCTVVPFVTTRTDGDHPAGPVAKSCNICDMPQGDQITNFTIGHQRIMRCTVVPSVTTRTDGDHPAGPVAKTFDNGLVIYRKLKVFATGPDGWSPSVRVVTDGRVYWTTLAEIATQGIDHEERHYDLCVAFKPRIHVSVFVPIGMPDDVLATLMSRYGTIQKTRRLHYKETDLSSYENGVRVIEFDALTQPIPSRVSFAGINIGFKYTGQPKTCVRCMAFDHLVKDCPAVRRPKTPNNPSPTTSTEPSPPAAQQNQPSSDNEDSDSDAEPTIADDPSPPTQRNLTEELMAAGTKRNLNTQSPKKTTKKTKPTDPTLNEPTAEDFNVFYDLFGPAGMTQPIPSRVSFAGINIGFKYTGQPKTCVRCMAFDHLVKDCPAVRRPKTPNNPSPTTSTEPSRPAAQQNQPSSDNEDSDSDAEPTIADDPSPPTQRNLTEELMAAGTKRNLNTQSPKKTTKKTKPTDPTLNEPTAEDFNVFYDLFGPAGATLKFSNVGQKLTTKARALFIFAEHGTHDTTKAGNLGLNGSPDIIKLWAKHTHKNKTADKATEELKKLYTKYFHDSDSDAEPTIADDPSPPTQRNLTEELMAAGTKRNLNTQSPKKTTKKTKPTDPTLNEPTAEDFNVDDLFGPAGLQKTSLSSLERMEVLRCDC
ncbi:hypothetical protein QZH41_003001 [Actinostola sp. cb2023]|nr:hypothetical protein QZH41_003001 [Actinostola sp. cb2023]